MLIIEDILEIVPHGQMIFKPGWRNGRRGGLKIRCPKGRGGSTPPPGTVRTSFNTIL